MIRGEEREDTKCERREQAVVLEQQLNRQKKKAANEELKKNKIVPVLVEVDGVRMGLRTREK